MLMRLATAQIRIAAQNASAGASGANRRRQAVAAPAASSSKASGVLMASATG